MSRKQWAILTLALLLSALGTIVGAVVLVDPFEVYHKATAFIPPITNSTQSYSNAGIAKTYDYDSVIIGSSMTENFTPSQLDRLLGGSFVKLSINGGSPFNHKQMMDMAFARQDMKTVLYGIDIDFLTYFYKTPKTTMPTHLYDRSPLNDAPYWFNKTILAKYIPKCLKTLGQSDPSQRDTMYNWGHLYEYGKERALANVQITGKVVAQKADGQPAVLDNAYRLNIEHNYVTFIEAHPDTQFLFFFSPYSLVEWYRFYSEGNLAYYLQQKEAVAEALLPYPNVKIFDFTAETDWILNLNNYIDAAHYGPWINDAMVEHIARDEYRVTDTETVRRNNQILRDHVDYLVSCGTWPDDFSAVTNSN